MREKGNIMIYAFTQIKKANALLFINQASRIEERKNFYPSMTCYLMVI
jgi:hypothetical protein